MENQSFLYCKPSVFVIGNEYEILVNLNAFGLCFIKVGDTVYYEENSGVLPSERTIVKIRVPQSELDKAKSYEERARKVRLAVRARYVHENYVDWDGQGATAMALYYKIVEGDEGIELI